MFLQHMLDTDDPFAPLGSGARQREAVINATSVIARLHAADHRVDTRGWPPDFTPQRIRERAEGWVAELTQIIEERAKPEYRIPAKRLQHWKRDIQLWRHDISVIAQYLDRMVEPLQLDDGLGSRPLHGDFSPDNVVASKNRPFLVDWQDSNIGSVWWEIAHSTWDMSPTEWNAVLNDYVKAAYNEKLVESPEVTREQALAFHAARAFDVLLRCSFFNWAAVNHDPSFEVTLAEGLDRLAGVARALESDRLVNFDTSRGATYLESPFPSNALSTSIAS